MVSLIQASRLLSTFEARSEASEADANLHKSLLNPNLRILGFRGNWTAELGFGTAVDLCRC